MTNLISTQLIRSLKILLVGITLTGSLVSIPSETSFAHHINPRASRTSRVPKSSRSRKTRKIRKTRRTSRISRKINILKKSQRSWIQIDLSRQRLIAWKGKKPVYAVIVSTGKKETPTRTGIFRVKTKLRKTRMKGEDYDVPDVPHTMYYQGGYAIHGAYWHRRFGTPVSHGCVNVAPDHAKWLYKWASVGTTIVIHQ
ncbi:L,D-transpeptidase [Calothrix rhizosoleniae]|uniref:L,D-transpeptidase n=1 Tax=Calothrix rhizosoleniae TaxID=888997 RepID=UPI000B49CCBA|nr:L,D-transpeptidase [Calothrix rhizosoleniae]